MAKLTLNDIASGYASVSKLNANNTLIEEAIENTLSRDGNSPNEMNADLDMNSHEVLNLAPPSSGSSAARWLDVASAVGLDTAVPNQTGNTGRYLKTTGTVLVWDDPAGSGGGFPVSAAETAAGVTPANLAYPYGDIRRYASVADAFAGHTSYIKFTQGGTYVLASQLTVPDGTIVDAYGATFDVTHNGVGILLGSNTSWLGGTFTGPSSSYVAGSRCFYATGTVNGAGVAPTRVTNIKIVDVKISEFGQYAIDMSYCSDVEIINPRITNTAYCGIMGYSATRMKVVTPTIDTINPENYSGELNAYGIAFSSMTGAGVDMVRYPRSSECQVEGGYIYNIQSWHALDTHGGAFINFKNVTIENCRRGIIFTHTGTVGTTDSSAIGCVYRNELSGTLSNGQERLSEAVWDIGVSTSVRNARNVVKDCVIYNGGKRLGVGGAVFLENSSDFVLKGCTLKNCNNQGVYVGGYVNRATIDSNVFIDVHGPGTGGGGPSNVIHGVLFNVNYFEDIAVTNNSFLVQNPSIDTYVMNSGITIGNYANHSVHIDGNVFEGVTTQVTMAGSNSWINLTGSWSGTISTGDQLLLTVGLSPEVYVAMRYSKVGDSVTLQLGAASGTSAVGNTGYAIGFLPSFLRPVSTKTCLGARVIDLGTTQYGMVEISSGGVITFRTCEVSGANFLTPQTDGGLFQGSGTKGHAAATITYNIN